MNIPTIDHPDVTEYLSVLINHRRMADLTIISYRDDLSKLVTLAIEIFPEGIVWSLLTPNYIRRFVSKLHAQGLSGRSIARVLSSWRGFYRWLIQKNRATLDPIDGLRAPKFQKKLPNPPSLSEMSQLLDGLKLSSGRADDWLWHRDLTMMELFYSSGLRLAELASLNVPAHDGSLDLINGDVTVIGKGSKKRVVPLGESAKQAITNWLVLRARAAKIDEPALFIGRHGTRLGHRAIRQRLDLMGQHAGLHSHLHPHRLRHAFASHLLQSSNNLRAVQEMLGHTSLSATQVYTHLDFQALAKVYDLAHPRAQRRKICKDSSGQNTASSDEINP